MSLCFFFSCLVIPETTADAGGMYPPSKAFVRGYNHVGSGWYFERVPAADAADGVEGTRVAYIIMSDLKGWFPALVINNAIGGAYVTFFEDLQAALEARTGWKGRIKA
jgi:hypothetical protein